MRLHRTCCFLLSTLIALPTFGDTVTSSVLVGADGKPLTYTTPPKNMLTGVANPDGYTQNTRTATYTVGEDGKSLMYRGKNTGMKTQGVNTPGSKIQVVDESIPAKPRAPKSGGTTPGTGTTPAAGTTPTTGTTPAPGATPSGGTAPTTGAVPSGGTTPSGGSTPGAGAAPKGGTTPSGGATPGAGTTPTTGTTPGAGTTPAGGATTSGGKTTGKAAGTTTKKATTKSKLKGGASKAMGVLAVAGGVAGVYEATSGQQPHTATDVVSGVISGTMAGMGVASVVPGVGTALGAGIGAVLGGVIAGSQLFSETDCLNDPVTGKYTCCHTVFTHGERLANIGDYMFCVVDTGDGAPTQYGTRQCQQGGSGTMAEKWYDRMKLDDAWEPECTYRYCNDDAPKRGQDNFIVHTADTENFCWNWDCVAGYTKQNGECFQTVTNANGSTTTGESAIVSNPDEPYKVAIAKIQAQRKYLINTCGATPTTAADNK